MPKISAIIIAKNEELVIERALSSLSFADEIIVVDSSSTDRTLEIAKSYNAKIIESQWRGFSYQRNLGLKAASYEWVFFLDADEKVTSECAKVLKKIASTPLDEHPNCYSIKRIEYFLGKELHYGPGNPSHQWRFFKKDKVKFEGEVHEYPMFDGPIGLIDAPIEHNPNLSIEKFLNKLNHYTTLEALDRFAQGQKTTLFHAFGTFFTTFLKNGIRYKGFLNGKVGFVLTLLESFSRVVRHLKLWVLWKVYNGKINIKLPYELPIPYSKKPPKKEELEKPVIKNEK